MAYALHLKTEQLGMIAIAMHSITPADHQADYYELRDKITRAWKERNPEGYALGVARGDIEELPPREVTRAQRALAKALASAGAGR